MVPSEREMIRTLKEETEAGERERTTSLQPTYEDSVQPDPDEDWDREDR